MRLEIYLDEKDFENLCDVSMEWASNNWRKQVGRFDPKPMYHWQMVYWFQSYPEVILARTFLSSRGFETQTVFDEGLMQWAILTDYRTENWRAE